jgi:Bardet-Biedl syndrome 2 protein
LVGTQTNLMAYDVERNSDMYYKDVPDGVHVMAFGKVPGVSGSVCLAGGNCSIQGYDAQGQEVFWTVTGDNVTALSFCDVDEDGQVHNWMGNRVDPLCFSSRMRLCCVICPPPTHS